MARFSMKIDVEPEDIPKLDDSHKRDCADAINNAINKTFKYTMIFAVAVAAVYAAYSLFGFTYLLRMGDMLPTINALVPLLAVLILIFEFIAGTMKRWAVALEVILQLTLAVLSMTQFQTMAIFPFAAYAIYLHVNLFGLMPHFDVISKLQGYPDFTSLPIGDVIKKVPGAAENNTADKEEHKGSEEKIPEKTEELPENKEIIPEKREKIPADKEISPDKAEEITESAKDIPQNKNDIPQNNTGNRSKKRKKGKK